jgi:L-iditol 2-dehydrogenase
MRELLAWPAAALYALPDSISDEAGALLEPLGVAIQCLDLGHLPFGGTAAVAGCGPIGLLVIQLLKTSGASWVLAIEPRAHRQQAAIRAGADAVTGPVAAVSELTGYGVDVAFELAGCDDAVRLALDAARPGGRAVLAGIPGSDTVTFRASTARRKGLTIALVRRMNEVYPRAIDFAMRGIIDLDGLVSTRAPLSEAACAFREAASRAGLKVIIDPRA